MGRHGMKFCMLCNPESNGTTGEEGTEAVGKYYLYPEPDQYTSGWIPVCEWCADMVPFPVVPISRAMNHPYWAEKREKIERERAMLSGPYEHRWDKDNLVGQPDGGDFWKCEKCGVRLKFYMGQQRPTQGCTVKESNTPTTKNEKEQANKEGG